MTDNIRPDPFLASGISLGIPNTDASSINNIDNVIFLDSEGNLRFKDSWIATQTDIDGNPIESVSLQDLWTRINGVYVKDGKLYFKDSTTSRAYSLLELVGAYVDTKNRLTNGGLYWIGRTSITNAECENIVVNVAGDSNIDVNDDDARIYIKVNNSYPTNTIGTKVFSIDKYIADSTFSNNNYKVDDNGDKRWHDVPNLKIIIPALDENKAVILTAKTNIRLINSEEPILFRLYDSTTSEVLNTISLSNNSNEPIEQQPILTYYGVLPSYITELNKLNCQCSTEEQIENAETEPPHTIKVQFYVNDHISGSVYNTTCSVITGSISGSYYTELINTDIKYDSLERRVIGTPNKISGEPIVNSSIDCVIFDTTPTDIVGRKLGSVQFNNQDMMKIEFDKNFSSADYTINLSCNKNINIYWSNKKVSGFTIKAEKKFTGTIDWIATKVKFEGNA